MGEAPGTRAEAVGSSVDIGHWLISWWPTQSQGPPSSALFSGTGVSGFMGVTKARGVQGPTDHGVLG